MDVSEHGYRSDNTIVRFVDKALLEGYVVQRLVVTSSFSMCMDQRHTRATITATTRAWHSSWHERSSILDSTSASEIGMYQHPILVTATGLRVLKPTFLQRKGLFAPTVGVEFFRIIISGMLIVYFVLFSSGALHF